jgi:hypothetical protein
MLCKLCNKEFPNYVCLYQHLRDVHKCNIAEYFEKYEGIVPFICDVCGEKCTTKISLATHKKKVHSIKSTRELEQERRESIKTIKCEECGELFDSLKNLSRHLKKHNMVTEEYYIKYMMKPIDFTHCKQCGKKNGFRFDRGFNDFCSFSCSTAWYAKNTNRIERAMDTLTKRKEENPDYHLSTSSERYWVLKGYSEQEAKQKVHERQQTFSKKIMIEKFGEEEGIKRWKERQNKWQETLLNKPDEEIERIARAKMNNGKGYSQISQDLFNSIMSFLPYELKVYYATRKNEDIINPFGDNFEYMIITPEKKMMFLDFFIPSINLCIEFDGDYWHGEKRGNQERDRIREENIIKFNPTLKIIHIKEKDYKKDKHAIINYCVNLINEELNGTTDTKI